MRELVENRQISLFPTGPAKDLVVEKQEQIPATDWHKSIPAQVFLNYFFAIDYHIQHSDKAYALQNLVHFINHKPELSSVDTEQIKKHLLNAWSTEYALRTTAELGDEHYLRNALHWTFPQAYHSIFAGLQGFLYTMGITGNQTELLRREIGRMVVKGVYPEPIAFYAAGHYGQFTVHRLPLAKYKPSLGLASEELEAQAQIGQFLRTTRRLRANSIRQVNQRNPSTAIRSIRTGEILQKFNQSHWNQLTWRFGYTSFFDLLSRLRISESHREIERFVEAEIDFTLFHKSLVNIVSYLNCIHESYIVRAIGLDTYRKWVDGLPAHLRDGFVKKRFTEKIKAMLEPVSENQSTVVRLSA